MVCFYSDDTGQKTKGRYFLIAGLAVSGNRTQIAAALKRAEIESGKRQMDWHHADPARRIGYLERACAIRDIHDNVFYRIYSNAPSEKFGILRADCLQAAINSFASKHRRAIHHEGLTRANRDSLKYELRYRGLACEVRNGKFEHSPEVRLADALAGMLAKVRFATDGGDYAHLLRDWFVEL